VQKADVKETAFCVATNGSDQNPGTMANPFATLEKAKAAVQERVKISRQPIRVLLREGTYYLSRPLEFSQEDSGSAGAPVTYTAQPGERITISGGIPLPCDWKPYRDGIWMAAVPAVKQGKLDFDQVFVNGSRQILARYPDYDMSDPGKSGYVNAAGGIPESLRSPVAGPNDDMTFSSGAPRGVRFDPAAFTIKSWAKPGEAVIHIYQADYWGNLQWKIRTVNETQKAIWFGDSGWQIGAKWYDNPAELDESSRFFIENVFEELDAPGEWYLDRKEGVLYYKPAAGDDLKKALVEVPVLEQLVRFTGTQDRPVHHIRLEGFRFAHTRSTFLKPRLEQIDSNCFTSDLGNFVARVHFRREQDAQNTDGKKAEKYSLEEWRKLGFDRNSVFADPMFVDPINNDYRVKPESPALKLGFKNFEMGSWGLTDEFPAQWRN